MDLYFSMMEYMECSLKSISWASASTSPALARGTMDSILQLTVYLASIDYYEPMNKIFKTYFPNGGPARTTVAVAALPGNSMLEINCIAAIVRQARK